MSAEVEEYIDLVPPERIPIHVAAPALRPDSKITIMLKRGACYGTCPSYDVAISKEGIEFEGHDCVVAMGKHTAFVDGNEVQELAKNFWPPISIPEAEYEATVTDMPAYVLSIAIDGQEKQVLDYVGRWEGMPTAITELEGDVDALGRTRQWVQAEGNKHGHPSMSKKVCMGGH